jgi:hypothetical protein
VPELETWPARQSGSRIISESVSSTLVVARYGEDLVFGIVYAECDFQGGRIFLRKRKT